jgi:hypothetical protein
MSEFYRMRFVFAIALLGSALAGCSGVAGSGGEDAGAVVGMQGDYPAYSQASLVGEATLVIEGTVVSREATVLLPIYEGRTPQENPMLGASKDEIEQAIKADGGVPATVVTIAVNQVHRGDIKPGSSVRVLQTGGHVGGVDYQVDGEVPLTDKSKYLVFLRESRDGAFVILGGSAGAFRDAGDGKFMPISTAMAPFDVLSAATVDALLTK